MKILVTGASGMLGKSLIESLSQCENLKILKPTRQELDLSNKNAVLAYFNLHKPNFVYHLAARVGGIAANMANPVEFFYDNSQINLNVIYAAYQTGVERFINVGSSCMYPCDRICLKEEDMLSGKLEPTNEGYAISKISSMLYCKYLSQQFNCHYKTVIPCNLYGEYDHFDLVNAHLVPAVLRKIHEAKISQFKTVSIWGDGDARREFMHVADLVSAFIMALENYDSMPMVINLGLGYDYTINEYYNIGAKVIGYDGQFVHDLSRPIGMKKKLLNVERAHAWGWSAKISIEAGMSRVYQHVLSHNVFETQGVI